MAQKWDSEIIFMEAEKNMYFHALIPAINKTVLLLD
jgi:hypothetical protein